MKYVKGAAPDKSTMAKSRKHKFAHVCENGADFRNMSRGPRFINPRCPMDTWTRPKRRRRNFSRICLSRRSRLSSNPPNEAQRSATEESDPQNCLSRKTRPIDLSRARRRTHDTSRTTRHARHDHGTGTGQRVRIPGRGSSASLLYHTPNLRYLC